MAKEKKNKRAKCPDCGAKLTKVRGKEERYCKECNYIEAILQPPGDSDSELVQTDQQSLKAHTDNPQTFFGMDGKLSVDGQDITLTNIKKDPPPLLTRKEREKAEAEHVAKIRAKRASGAVVSKGLMNLQKVTVYCWSRGNIRGFAYGINCPYPNPKWKKEMTGVEAFHFLTRVKRSNNQQKLESGSIIEYSET